MDAPRHALALLLLVAAPLAAAADWRIDPVHSRVLLGVEHLGLSTSWATLSGPEGTLAFDGEGRGDDARTDWAGAAVEVRLPLARLDFGDPEWNATMQGRRWFEADIHPELRFTSTRVEPVDARHARVHGLLRVRDVEREVVLEARFNGKRRHPLTLRRTLGFSATATLDRRDFGLDAFPTMIGDRVALRIEVEATRATEPPSSEETGHADPQHD